MGQSVTVDELHGTPLLTVRLRLTVGVPAPVLNDRAPVTLHGRKDARRVGLSPTVVSCKVDPPYLVLVVALGHVPYDKTQKGLLPCPTVRKDVTVE